MYTINILYMVFHVGIRQNDDDDDDDDAELRSKIQPELSFKYEYFE